MIGEVVPVGQQENTSAPNTNQVEPVDLECPICYQEYNQYNKCPRILECLHVFCTECLQRIQLCPNEAHNPRTIPCPLCRHLTPLDSGDTLSLPCSSNILARLPPMAFCLPASMAASLATVSQRVVLSLEGDSRDARFIILPTVSLRVQQMHPDMPYGVAPGLVDEEEVIEQSKKTLFCVQLLAIIFWVMFVVICLVGVVFGPHFLNKNF